MTRRRDLGPHSGREVSALVMISLIAWCGLAWTIHGLAVLTVWPALALGIAGGGVILVAGAACAWRWRRR
ncbi:hypothetical protein [Sediminicoccus sp. BL-A-41-H5]|uniref:hypothetical protein n=1 Tax=Sediminicoccus sp. BL-A-41-H5 TaxID=3421106 RepID=UPI003D6654C3